MFNALLSLIQHARRKDLLLAEVDFGKCHRLIQQVLLHLCKLGRCDSCPEILAIVFVKPDFDSYIWLQMNVSSSLPLTSPSTKTLKDCFYQYKCLSLRMLKAMEFMFRTGDGTAALSGGLTWEWRC